MTEFVMGKPCKYGHGGKRYKSGSRACVECETIRNQTRIKTPEYKAYQAAHYERNKMRKAEYKERPEVKSRSAAMRRLRAYDLTPTEYNFMLAGQGFCCALCGADDPRNTNGWHTDHCHVTNKVRGILCATCNHGLGKLGDTPESLERAYLYTKGELSWTNSTTPTSEMDGPSTRSPHTGPNAKPQAGWSAGLL